MKGLVIKSTTWDGETYKVAATEGIHLSVEMSYRYGAIWCPSGDNGKESYSWRGGYLDVGDEVEIRVAEITPEEITPPTEIHKQGTVPPLSKIDDPELWADKLYTYLRYKKILEDEGLI